MNKLERLRFKLEILNEIHDSYTSVTLVGAKHSLMGKILNLEYQIKNQEALEIETNKIPDKYKVNTIPE